MIEQVDLQALHKRAPQRTRAKDLAVFVAEAWVEKREDVIGLNVMRCISTPLFLCALFLTPSLVGCVNVPTPILHVHPESSEEGLELVGHGQVVAEPDIATITVGVRQRAATAQEATQAVSKAVDNVMKSLTSSGIKPQDVQTRNLSLYEDREHRPMPPASPVSSSKTTSVLKQPQTFFVARNTIQVIVRDLARVGEILGQLTQVGINEVRGIEFGLDNRDSMRNKARDMAIMDAKQQAIAAAKSAGVRLGRVISIVVDNDGGYSGGVRHSSRARVRQASAKVPVSAGSLEVEQSVRVRFEILAEPKKVASR